MFTTMDPKLMCPTLTIMLTKTIKALCEVNIKFEKKLEISGSLHVRSDGEKILTCLIDEESVRPSGGLLQQRNTPETALAQQSAVMALLTASQQMAANRSPGLASPPVRNFTPTVSMQAADMTSRHSDVMTPVAHLSAHLPHAPARPAHQPAPPPQINESHAPTSVHNSSPQEQGREMEQHRLPPVNSLIQNREVLLGMLQDKSRHKPDKPPRIDTLKTETSNKHHSANTHHADIKEEPGEKVPLANEAPPPTPATQPAHTQAPPPSSTTANGAMHLSNLPPFPVLVNTGAAWPPPAPIPAIPAPPPAAKTPRTEVDSPPQDPEIVTTINSKGQKKFQCMFCGILLSTKNYLKNHINAVHTKARVYPCEICERYFYSAGALRIHKLRHHWAGSKKHKCSHCQESFLLPVELRRHLLKKHGDTSGGGVVGEADEAMKENARGGTPNLTIEQIRQFQLQEHLRAQQHLLEQEQAIAHLQHQISDQGEPLELSMRESEEPEPGEITGTEAMHSQMTDQIHFGKEEVHSLLPESTVHHQPEVNLTQAHFQTHPPAQHSASSDAHVIVQPEPPPEVTHMDVGEMHPNQNEMGIPDDEIDEEDDEEESRDVTHADLSLKSRVQSHVTFVPQPSPAIEIGNKIG